MGYEVHITRAPDWVKSESNPIRLEEWLAYIESDPEMRLDDFAETQTPAGETLRYENRGLAVWTAWPHSGQDGSWAWFDYRGGRIVVTNPDDAILAKMCAIAKELGARVQGDEGEYFPEGSGQDADDSEDESPPGSKGRWWRRIFGR